MLVFGVGLDEHFPAKMGLLQQLTHPKPLFVHSGQPYRKYSTV